MPASSRRRIARRQLGDDGVSEVLGFMLTFGIISMILILAMVAFTRAQQDAGARVVTLHADGAANRIAGIVVEAALFAENYDPTKNGSAEFSYRLDLPETFEGVAYDVNFTASGDAVAVTLRGGATATAQLFQAGGDSGAKLCPLVAPVPGGAIVVRYGNYTLDSPTAPPCIFLEASP